MLCNNVTEQVGIFALLRGGPLDLQGGGVDFGKNIFEHTCPKIFMHAITAEKTFMHV